MADLVSDLQQHVVFNRKRTGPNGPLAMLHYN